MKKISSWKRAVIGLLIMTFFQPVFYGKEKQVGFSESMVLLLKEISEKGLSDSLLTRSVSQIRMMEQHRFDDQLWENISPDNRDYAIIGFTIGVLNVRIGNPIGVQDERSILQLVDAPLRRLATQVYPSHAETIQKTGRMDLVLKLLENKKSGMQRCVLVNIGNAHARLERSIHGNSHSYSLQEKILLQVMNDEDKCIYCIQARESLCGKLISNMLVDGWVDEAEKYIDSPIMKEAAPEWIQGMKLLMTAARSGNSKESDRTLRSKENGRIPR
jgi:hypothetical protein